MNKEHQHNSFSLIADFDGDISTLFSKPVAESLPILPLRNMVLFPGVVAPVTVGRESSLKLIRQAEKNGGMIGVVCQRIPNIETPQFEDLFTVGVAAKVMKVIDLHGSTSVILQSYSRIELEELTKIRPYHRARVHQLEEILPDEEDNEYIALMDACKETTMRLLRASETPREEAILAIKNINHPVFLGNFICTNLPFSVEEKAELLEISDQKERAYKLLTILNREYQFAMLKQNIQMQTREELDQQQKEYFLQQQIKNIQSELGESMNEDVVALRKAADKANLPKKARAAFEKELAKLERIPMQAPDYNVQLNYLQTLTTLPWGKKTQDNLNLNNAERQLNRDHYGLEKVKERILEHLAMLRVSGKMKSPIICLYGPPGVGKTSLGKSIATALGRKYVRISLGGVHDEAEIRGHRRTYVGAMPGRIIKALIKAESSNPLFVLDEIDKVSDRNHNGDPQSALLEVLDPEQNNSFHDNFLDLDYDLSDVMFVATANTLSTIPRPLLDRMEIIEVEGYLAEEKKEIAKKHLIPKAHENVNFEGGKLKFSAAAIDLLVEKYTRESGVRQLEKQIEKVFRKVALKDATVDGDSVSYLNTPLKAKQIEELLGKPLYNRDIYQGNDYAGVVTGLAWTAVGGEILFIETSVSKSKAPKLTLTGNLGDVMKESAVLALEYIKAHADEFGLDYRIFDQWSIHVHVPEGATPKDGPSAGITIATSLMSALSGRKVRENTAMTGEITLRGRVLPVGGIKEKILAAKRAGIKHILMSKENMKDVQEISEKYIDGLDFHFVEDVKEVFDYALLNTKAKHAVEVKAEDPQENK